MNARYIEVQAGTVGVLKDGNFFEMGETDITKVAYVCDDEVFILGGAVAFKVEDVRFIEKAV